MYFCLQDDSGKHKKAKGVNKYVVARISQNGYKDVLLNNKCLRNLINRIENKNYKIGNFEISKISLSCFDDKMCISCTMDMMN